MNQVLAVFDDMTNVVSGSDYLTFNLFLPKVWKMKEILAIKASDMNGYIRSMTTKMSKKIDKYWGECNMLISLAVVLDPRYKMKLTTFCFSII